jgi:SAM-dependent methyltransferase
MKDSVSRWDARSGDYARYRPSYPAAVIDAIFAGMGPPQTLRVVDIGAGTGISSRLLVERGAQVIAAEPNAEMRAKAEATGLDVRDARADALGLPDGSADVMTCFQAFHWFANADAVREMTRVLRPSGRLAIVFNERDDKDPFTHAYGQVVDNMRDRMAIAGYRNGSEIVRRLLVDGGLQHLRLESFVHGQRLDYDGLLGRLRSTSYAPPAGTPEHAAMLEAVTRAFERFQENGEVAFAFRTDVYLGEKS